MARYPVASMYMMEPSRPSSFDEKFDSGASLATGLSGQMPLNSRDCSDHPNYSSVFRHNQTVTSPRHRLPEAQTPYEDDY